MTKSGGEREDSVAMARLSAGHRRFVTFEGVDGAGKSTHLTWFADALADHSGRVVVVTREPGGTPLGEALREILLHQPMDLETEALLMFADRRQDIVDVIAPALARGAWVVCDRFSDSTLAYQGGGRGLDAERIQTLSRWVHADLEPGTTILFDLDPDVARRRRDATRDGDRFEQEPDAFFRRVRDTYLRLAAEQPARFRQIDGAQTISKIRKQLEEIIVGLCAE